MLTKTCEDAISSGVDKPEESSEDREYRVRAERRRLLHWTREDIALGLVGIRVKKTWEAMRSEHWDFVPFTTVAYFVHAHVLRAFGRMIRENGLKDHVDAWEANEIVEAIALKLLKLACREAALEDDEQECTSQLAKELRVAVLPGRADQPVLLALDKLADRVLAIPVAD